MITIIMQKAQKRGPILHNISTEPRQCSDGDIPFFHVHMHAPIGFGPRGHVGYSTSYPSYSMHEPLCWEPFFEILSSAQLQCRDGIQEG